jgi:hypothetical protein
VFGLGATLLAIGVVVDRMLARAFDEELDERLTSAAGVVRFATQDMSADVRPQVTAARLLEQLRFVEVDVAIVGRGVDGSPLPFVGSDSMLVRVSLAERCRDAPITRHRLSGALYRFLIQCVRVERSPSPLTVIVGTCPTS